MAKDTVIKLKSEFLGKGKMTYANGASYDGDWIEGKREGFGTYYWGWNDNIRHTLF